MIASPEKIVDKRFTSGEKEKDEKDSKLGKDKRPSKPTYRIGESDGGPGKWSKEFTPINGADYQKKVTGAPTHVEYVVEALFTKSGKINLTVMIRKKMY